MNHARIANFTAPWMFTLALTFLICQAVLVVLWVDVPSLAEQPSLIVTDSAGAMVAQTTKSPAEIYLQRLVLVVMGIIWPTVWIESVYHWCIRPKTAALRPFHIYTLLFCILPSLRMCARSVEMDFQLWLPGLRWQRADKRLRRRLARMFSVPMIGIAMLILPVLLTEFLFKEQVARYLWLRLILHMSTGVIWFAFAAEFILMVSIAEKKWHYLRQNWVDLAIIALPLFSFLRSLRFIRATKLFKFGKLSQLVRAYRLRGTAIKGFRALVLLDVATRFGRNDPEAQLKRLQDQLAIQNRETRLLRLAIARLQREITESGEVTNDPPPPRSGDETVSASAVSIDPTAREL
ncbi:MAG: potassium channel protein [Planctomycetota bacterium]